MYWLERDVHLFGPFRDYILTRRFPRPQGEAYARYEPVDAFFAPSTLRELWHGGMGARDQIEDFARSLRIGPGEFDRHKYRETVYLDALCEDLQDHCGQSMLLRERPQEESPAVPKRHPLNEAIQEAREAPKSFIVVEVVGEDERPRSGVDIELLLADGTVLRGRSDAHGIMNAEPIPAGQVHIQLRGLDGVAWKPAQGSSASEIDARASRVHVVRSGENLTRIAKQYGLGSWERIWKAPENAAFAQKRKNPNLLFPGDELHIPGVTVSEIVRPSGQTHRIVLLDEAVEFRVVLQDHNQLPYKNEPYALHLLDSDRPEPPRSGTTDAAGKVIESLPDSCRRVRVELPGPQLRFEFSLQTLLPIPTDADLKDADDPATPPLAIKALQMRLRALGFDCGPIDGVMGPRTRRALALVDGSAPVPDPTYDPMEVDDDELERLMLAATHTDAESDSLSQDTLDLVDSLFAEGR